MPDSYSVIHRATPKLFNRVQKSHHWDLSNELDYWRAQMGWEAKVAKPRLPRPFTEPVEVTVVHHRTANMRGPLPDAGAVFIAAKGGVDGLVDVKVLTDDGPNYVRRLTFEAPVVSGWDGLELILRPVAA